MQRPSEIFVSDCANEFSLACTHAAKGLLRNELLFAHWIFEHILHIELLRLLGYIAGVRNGFPLNTGKHNKWLLHYLAEKEREELSGTYKLENTDMAWDSLYTAIHLFENVLSEVCASLSYTRPNYLERAQKYIEVLKGLK